MGCFCYDLIIKGQSFEARETTFTDINPKDSSTYCKDWFNEYAIELGVKYGSPAAITVINSLVSITFNIIAPYELRFT